MVLLLEILVGLLLFFVGAAVFSFVNVVIYRVPRHLPLGNSRSVCPSCGEQLRGYDMVPCLSWLFLRGKCRFCKAPISPRYFFVELLGGVLALLSVWRFGWNEGGTLTLLKALLVFLALAILTAVAFVDGDTQEIPNGFVLFLLLCGAAAVFVFPEVGLLDRLIGLLAVSVPLLLIALLVPGGFGGGDIKLMAAAGLFLGWKLCLFAAFVAIITGGAYGAWLLLTKRKTKKEQFAFGPFLCAGVACSLFFGETALNWYFRFL